MLICFQVKPCDKLLLGNTNGTYLSETLPQWLCLGGVRHKSISDKTRFTQSRWRWKYIFNQQSIDLPWWFWLRPHETLCWNKELQLTWSFSDTDLPTCIQINKQIYPHGEQIKEPVRLVTSGLLDGRAGKSRKCRHFQITWKSKWVGETVKDKKTSEDS